MNLPQILVTRRWRVRSDHQLPVDPAAEIDVLSGGKAENVLRGGQGKAETTSVMAYFLPFNQLQGILDGGIGKCDQLSLLFGVEEVFAQKDCGRNQSSTK